MERGLEEPERSAGGRVFVGRDAELRELRAALDDALGGSGSVVLVAGEPGIGKSRLQDELARVARERGVRVLQGRCWEAGGAPTYWPWVQALRGHVRDLATEELCAQLGPEAAELAQILPEVRRAIADLPAPAAPPDPERARFRLFDATASFLRRASAAQPLLITLDDLQAADTPSLLLLRFVAGELADARILVVCAYRDIDLTPAAALAAAVRELARHPSTRRLHVGGLAIDDVERLIEGSSGVAPKPNVVAAVYRETEGNPLFVEEVVRLLVAEGRLEAAAIEPAWRLRIPESVREVIERRLERLSAECHRALEVASVAGREFGLDAVEHLSGLAGDELLAVLEEAIEARVLDEVHGALGRLRFSHALIRDTFYDKLSTARRIRLHRRLGEVLEGVYAADPGPHLAELAHHFFAAAPGGDVERAIDYARRAGDRAASLYGYEDAARFYRMALEAVALREPADEPFRCELLLALGEALGRSGDDPAAKTAFLEAARIARRCELGEQLARAALGYGGRFVWSRAGGDGHLVPLLEAALAGLPPADSEIRVRLMGRLACARRSDPDREGPAALSEEAVAMARRLGDLHTLAYALDAHYGAHWWYDNPTERLELAEELERVARESQDGERIADALVGRLAALLDLGRIAEAEAVLGDLERVASEIRQPSQQFMARSGRALLALFRGEFAHAEAIVEDALRIGEHSLPADAEAIFRSQHFWLRREQDRLEDLEPAMRRTAEEFRWYPMFRCFLAELYVDLGRDDDASRLLAELTGDGLAGLLPRDNEWLVAATSAADVCAAVGAHEAAAPLYEALLPVADLNAVGINELARGSVARPLGALAALLGRHEEAAFHYEAALAANERMGARPWLARTQYEYARMLLARDAPGDRARAAELLAAALETARSFGLEALAARIEGGGRPVEPSPPTGSAGVFRREGEYWSIAFDGEAFRLKDSKGLQYLARLLAAPGEELHALELVGTHDAGRTTAEEDGLAVGGLGDAGELLDAQAKAAYRERLAELEEEIDQAEEWNDTERAARAREERDFIARELSAAVGLGGRDRRAASASERARVNVTRAIKSALARIEEHSPALGAHLAATVRTGTFCAYAPDPRLGSSWEL